MKRLSLFFVFAMALVTPAHAEFTIYEADGNTVKIHGWADVRAVYYQSETELVDGVSRLNINFTRDMGDGWEALAAIETGVNLVGQTNVDFAGGDTFQTRRDDLLNLRLGYVGVKHERYGQLTLGKQWGVYYDVGGITDWGHSWGSAAAGVYNFNGDGGLSGTGRAEKAIQYRKQWENLSLALQTQLQGTEDDIDEFDVPGDPEGRIEKIGYDSTVGGAITYRVNESHLFAATYNAGTFEGFFEDGSTIKRDDKVVAVAYQYGKYGDGLFVGAFFNDAEYHELDNLSRIIPGSTGIEVFASYRGNNRLMPYIEYNSLDADSGYGDVYPGDEFQREFVAFGAVYFWNDETEIYLDIRHDSSSMSSGQDVIEDDGVGLGMRFYF